MKHVGSDRFPNLVGHGFGTCEKHNKGSPRDPIPKPSIFGRLRTYTRVFGGELAAPTQSAPAQNGFRIALQGMAPNSFGVPLLPPTQLYNPCTDGLRKWRFLNEFGGPAPAGFGEEGGEEPKIDERAWTRSVVSEPGKVHPNRAPGAP